jgi:hypothetical protein
MPELCALDEKDIIQSNFQRMFGCLASGAKILFIENKHPTFIRYLQSCKLVSGLRQQNDDGEPVDLELPDLTETFEMFDDNLNRSPRMNGNIVSKLITKA